MENHLTILEKTSLSSIFLYTLPSKKQFIVKKANHSRLKKEYDVLSQLNHPNIIKVFNYGYDPSEKHFMVSEYCENGDIIKFLSCNFNKILNKENILNQNFEKFWRTMLFPVVDALIYLKSKNLAHLDIKPDNILLNADYEVKLCDFEFIFQTKKEDGTINECDFLGGTEIYYSPEICEGLIPYDPFKSEIFSLAVSILNMMLGTQIFITKTNNNTRFQFIKNEKFAEFWKSIKISKILSVELKDLIENMMKYNPDDRIDLDGVKKHVWFSKPVFSKTELLQFLN